MIDLGISIYSSIIRTMFIEISRLLNHLLAVTTQSLDLGSVTPFLWALEDKGKLSYHYKAVSGARMHTACLRSGGISLDLPIFSNKLDSRLRGKA